MTFGREYTGRASAGATRGSPPEDDNVHGRFPGLRVVADSRGLPGEPGHQWHSSRKWLVAYSCGVSSGLVASATHRDSLFRPINL
jgi:hypothetical protein